MDMNIMFSEEILRDIPCSCCRTQIADARLRRFFHDIPQLSGQKEFSLSGHDVYFNLQRITADAGPGQSTDNTNLRLRIGRIDMIFRFAQIVFQRFFCDTDNCLLYLLLFLLLKSCLPADSTDLPLQRPDPGFFGVCADDLLQRPVLQNYLFFFQSVGRNLSRNKMFFCDMKLFIIRVAVYLDQLHAVQQGTRNILHIVCRSNKENIREINRNLYVMILKRIIFRRIQNLQKGRRDIPFVIAAGFINFIQQHQGISYLCLMQSLSNASGHRADIGSPVSPDLRLVPHPAQ